jgi:hypothetical protein
MKPRKAKPTEPLLIDELNQPLRDIVNDIKAHGLDALKTVRETHLLHFERGHVR